MTTKLKPMRRTLLKTAGAAIPLMLYGKHGWTANKQIVMGTWGGDTETSLGTVARLAKEKYGIDLLMDVGSPSTRKTKIIAQLKRPSNSMDLTFLVDSDMYYMNQMNALHTLDKSKIPLYDTIQSDFTQSPYSLPVMYSALVLVFRKDISNPPASLKDLWKPEYAGRIGFADFSFDKIIPSVAQAFTGDPNDLEAGFKELLELKKNGVRLYASNEAVGNALNSGEVDVSFMWKGRAHQWMDAGLDIDYAVPTEGVYPVFFEMAITQNSQNVALSHDVLGCLLEPEVQQVMATKLGQIPVVHNSGLPPDVEKLIGFSEEERKKFIKPDYAHLTANLSRMLDFWNQEFKG